MARTPAPPRVPDPPPPSGGGGPNWRFLITGWPGKVTAVLGLIVTAGAAYQVLLPIFWPPRVSVTLTCHSKSIVLQASNTGGRSANLERPVFTMLNPRRFNDRRFNPYSMEALDDPFNASNRAVTPGEPPRRYEYSNPFEFFDRNETVGRSCRIHVVVPITPDRGEYPPAEDDCECVYP